MKNIKGYIKYLLLAIFMIVVLCIIGANNIKNIDHIESESSSYTKTKFDYYISSPSEEQINEIRGYSSVNRIFPCYAFNNAFVQNNKTKDIFLLLNNDLKDYDISLFNDKTLIKGNFDEEGIMLDEYAANLLGLNVGDEAIFNIMGKTFKRNVSAIYLTSTYGTLTKGIALAKYSADIQKEIVPVSYGFAFIESSDSSALTNDLKDYAGEGNVAITYEQYVVAYCGTKPPYQTEEEFEASNQAKYNQYREDILAAARRGGNQVVAKEDSYTLIKNKLNTTQKNVDTFNIITAISSFVVFALVNIIFILTKKSDDKTEMLEGLSSSKLFLRHIIIASITAAFIFMISFVTLLIIGSNTHFLSTIMPMILIFTLPTLGALLALILFDFIYVKILYSNNSK